MPQSGSSAASEYIAPLSSRERLILAEWERARVSRVTRADVAGRWGAAKADKITSALVRKGALRRVGKGIFLVVPLRAQARPTTPSAAALVAALLSDEPYYLGGLWALTHHRLTLQQYATRMDAFVARDHQARTLAHAHLRFHRVPPSRIADGHEVVSIEGAPVRVSTPEETLLDLLDYPDMAGGTGAALALVEPALGRVDLGNLLRRASAVARSSSCQRLGVLLERMGVPPSKLAALRRRALATQSLTSMVPGTPRRGQVNTRWRVVENDR
ncbi:MAG TPA: type IV toxin-antitoxin system AbiEi family antitoxin [Polyangiaceae bacterium]|jgi:predicted transcriptional regulator of viral defense system